MGSTTAGVSIDRPEETRLPADTESMMKLAQEMHDFAVQETTLVESNNGAEYSPKMKSRPKPPKPRTLRPTADALTSPFGKAASNDDYVVDTYVWERENSGEQLDVGLSNATGSSALAAGRVGILVIDGDDEETFWETFDAEDGSKASAESDDEDENGQHTLLPFSEAGH